MNRITVKRVAVAGTVLVLLVVAGVIGYVIARHSAPAAPVSAAVTQPAQRKVLYWYDPMTPQQHFDHPGVSPMGMKLEPKYAEAGGAGNPNIVRINPAEVQNLGMRTAVVKVAPLSDTVNVPGTIAWDQDLSVTVSARVNATIEKLYVRAPFTVVAAGQPLAEILAPQWSAAAAEYFALANAKSPEGRTLRKAALERLHVLGMNNAVIRSLGTGSGTITLRAPVSGVVSVLDVKQGQQVGEGGSILSINGLDKVWVDAAIPQAQIGGITAGTPIAATVTALPGEAFRGEVEALLPDVSVATRTQSARIVLDNPRHDLAPGMFASLNIAGAPSAPHPLVPTEAIISDGVHTRVIEALDNGEFKPVLVRIGRSANGLTAILAGLHGGERIVTSGQFLIDSEASLSGALQRMEAGAAPSGTSQSSLPASASTLEPRSPASGTKMNMPMSPASSSSSRATKSSMPGMSMPPTSSTGAGGAP